MRLWLFLLSFPAAAHMVSMSTGELKVEANHAHYVLRIPMYEVAHIREPGHTLFDHIRFRAGGEWGKPSSQSCSGQEGTYVCVADYQFSSPVEAVEVECTFAQATVPNHVHLLRAYRGDKTDQAVFDLSFTRADLRFRPPTALASASKQASAGFMRAAGGLAPLLFLAGLVLGARSRRELVALTICLLAAECIACALAPRITLSLSPRFIEAAAALTVAYLAFEIILLPDSGMRWLVVAVLGLFHGAYFSMFLAESGYNAFSFLAGVGCAELLVITILALLFGRLVRIAALRRLVPVAASMLLTVGLVWFFVRLRS